MTSDIIRQLEKEQMKDSLPELHVGDTLEVRSRIVEGDKERIQLFIGTLIARKGGGTTESIVVRRLVQGEGVERRFRLHSPLIVGIEVKRAGKARRAKLYYLRGRTGKAARVKERKE